MLVKHSRPYGVKPIDYVGNPQRGHTVIMVAGAAGVHMSAPFQTIVYHAGNQVSGTIFFIMDALALYHGKRYSYQTVSEIQVVFIK